METKIILESIKEVQIQKTSGSHDDITDFSNFVGMYEGEGIFSHYIIFISDFACKKDSMDFKNLTVNDILTADDSYKFKVTQEMRFINISY